MKNLNVTLLILLVVSLYSEISSAQQDAQYTQYMYNTLSINPAYAGSRDVLSFVGLYRSQWVGLEGAPKTATVSLHSPVGKNVALGVNIVNDEIFITNETYIDIDFSYTVKTSTEGRLALGVKGGAHLLDVDSNRANTGAENNSISEEINIDNRFSPQVGVGAYYYTNKFYLGLSAPNLLDTEHFDNAGEDLSASSLRQERVNYYLMTGYTFDLNDDLKFKPAGLVKLVSGAPLQVDLSANFLIKEKITLGAAYRWSAAFSGMIGFQISDQFMLGFAYDRETTELQQFNDGSYEVFLRYELFNRNNKMVSPRFF